MEGRADQGRTISPMEPTYNAPMEPWANIPKGSNPVDMSLPPACAAAKGVPGVNLACIDFNTVPDGVLSPTPGQPLKGWAFSLDTDGMACWQILTGKLQTAKEYKNFNSSCTFKMPALTDADFSKYNSFTIAIVHRLDIDGIVTDQSVQVMLGGVDPTKRLMTQWTGRQPRQQSIIKIEKAELPAAVINYQPLFGLNAPAAASTSTGWLIESIAINAQE